MNFSFGFIFLLIILAIISVLPYMNAVYLLDNSNNNVYYYNIALANIIILSIFLFISIILCFAIYSLNEYLIGTLAIFWVIFMVMNNILSLTTAIILIVEYHNEPSKIIPAFIYLSFTCIGILQSIFYPTYYHFNYNYKYNNDNNEFKGNKVNIEPTNMTTNMPTNTYMPTNTIRTF